MEKVFLAWNVNFCLPGLSRFSRNLFCNVLSLWEYKTESNLNIDLTLTEQVPLIIAKLGLFKCVKIRKVRVLWSAFEGTDVKCGKPNCFASSQLRKYSVELGS